MTTVVPTRISTAGMYVFAAVLGVTWLATVPLTNSLVGQIFGVKYLSTLFSIAFLGHQLGAFVGAWAGGAVFDLTASYLPVWLAAIAPSGVAAGPCVPLDAGAVERTAGRGAACEGLVLPRECCYPRHARPLRG